MYGSQVLEADGLGDARLALEENRTIDLAIFCAGDGRNVAGSGLATFGRGSPDAAINRMSKRFQVGSLSFVIDSQTVRKTDRGHCESFTGQTSVLCRKPIGTA